MGFASLYPSCASALLCIADSSRTSRDIGNVSSAPRQPPLPGLFTTAGRLLLKNCLLEIGGYLPKSPIMGISP
jgi:hypothetical protein